MTFSSFLIEFPKVHSKTPGILLRYGNKMADDTGALLYRPVPPSVSRRTGVPGGVPHPGAGNHAAPTAGKAAPTHQ